MEANIDISFIDMACKSVSCGQFSRAVVRDGVVAWHGGGQRHRLGFRFEGGKEREFYRIRTFPWAKWKFHNNSYIAIAASFFFSFENTKKKLFKGSE